MTPTDSGSTSRSRARFRDASWVRLLLAAAVALTCFGVLIAHVHLGFERVRMRVVTTPVPALSPDLRIPLPDLKRLQGAPMAIVARVRAGERPVRLRILLSGTPVADARVEAGDDVRIDGSAPVPGGSDAVLEVRGDVAGWRLDALEVANVHGFSEGAFSFVLVPRGGRGASDVPWWLAMLVALELFVLGLSAAGPGARAWRVAHRPLAALVLLVFGITLVADVVTPYTILLSPGAFLLAVGILYAGPLASGLWQLVALAPPARTLLAFSPHVALTVMVLSGVARFYDPETGFTRLIMFGSEFAPTAVPALRDQVVAMDSPYGYDGQFYAQLALDPLLRDPATIEALDSAAYRARRVLIPALAHLAGLGQTWSVLQAYALINVASWLVLAWVLLRWLPAGGLASTLGWIGVMASHGLLVSMRLALSDGPSALLIALSVAALQANRRWLTALLVGVSGLAKETSLLAGAILLPTDRPWGRRAAETVTQGAFALAPFALWIMYLTVLDLPGESGGERNFAMPLTEYAHKWVISLREIRAEDPYTWTSLLTLIALTTQVAFLGITRAWREPWWRVGAGYAVLMLVVGPAVWDGQPGAITRVVLPMSVAFNILVPRHRWFWPLWILGNANLLHGPPELGLTWDW